MSEPGEQLTTFEEDFAVMQERLVGMGAAQEAIVGTVIDDGRAFRAAYYVDLGQQPPVIAELLYTRAQSLGTLTRVAVIEDEPHMATSKHRLSPDMSTGPQLQLILADQELPGLAAGEDRELPFTYVYDNVQGFEPNA